MNKPTVQDVIDLLSQYPADMPIGLTGVFYYEPIQTHMRTYIAESPFEEDFQFLSLE